LPQTKTGNNKKLEEERKRKQICEYRCSSNNVTRKEKHNHLISNNQILPQCVARLASDRKEWEHKQDVPNTCEEIQMQILQFEVVVVATVVTLLVQGKADYWVLQLLAL
jgi:hypothetical protein